MYQRRGAGYSPAGLDTEGVSSHREPPLLIAATTAACVPEESSSPWGRVASLLTTAGEDSKEAEARAVFAESNNVMNS